MDYAPTYTNPDDATSRLLSQTEWSISKNMSHKINLNFGPLEIDMFALATNKKLEKYTSLSTKTSSSETINDPSNGNHTRPQEWKVTADKEQGMVTRSMALKRARYGEEGITEDFIDIILNSEKTRKRYKKYDAVKTSSLQRCNKNKTDNQKLEGGCIYRVMKPRLLAKNPESITSESTFKYCFKAIAEIQVKSFDHPTFNIQPIIEKSTLFSRNKNLKIETLTQKLRWLFSVRGFMRPSDIERIDYARITVTEDYTKLIGKSQMKAAQ
ncbi:hypothetical protein BB560_001583 [Smittium megazygosporum]|uniref:Uncharacterized protein n=1 Tax=Smittium megazygosporum TaxID=133381 RepID=A0A2T9ZH77_9FUNG|nr:hypothetical protein BB560_001583 [Smittium megazygosporum]